MPWSAAAWPRWGGVPELLEHLSAGGQHGIGKAVVRLGSGTRYGQHAQLSGSDRERPVASLCGRNVVQRGFDPTYHALESLDEGRADRSILARDLTRRRGERAAEGEILSMTTRDVILEELSECRLRASREFVEPRAASFQAFGERFGSKGLLRGELRVQRAMGEARCLADLGHANAVDTALAKEPTGFAEQRRPVLGRPFPGDSHARPFVVDAINIMIALLSVGFAFRFASFASRKI